MYKRQIGDYTFKDNNNNGVQDEGDVAFPDVEVTLYQKVKKSVGGQYITETNTIGTTRTDSNGKYLFTGLPCNYLKAGRAEGSTAVSYTHLDVYKRQVMIWMRRFTQ